MAHKVENMSAKNHMNIVLSMVPYKKQNLHPVHNRNGIYDHNKGINQKLKLMAHRISVSITIRATHPNTI